METPTKDRPAKASTNGTPSNPAMLRPLQDIVDDLHKDVPARMLKNKKMGGNQITFIPWYRAAKIMDFYAPGWEYEITDKTITGTHIMLTVRVYLNAKEGRFYREATGIEALEVKGYGDPSSNAESMAFRRACAKWGLGINLYEKED